MKKQRNLGQASIFIRLADNKIRVYHGQDGDLLFEREADGESWGNIWSAIKQ